jgi:predicted pyridoxine 5'-phosphate oxidase superfamily flavin-nucleotide-binding protein
MASKFLDLTVTDSVRQAQDHYYGKSPSLAGAPDRDTLTDEETEFIQSRDSFYMATVTENGWPYLQHRGGAPGFLRVAGPNLLAFPDYKGNRQMLSTGNVAVNDRVNLFLMDYPSRNRLKILGHARVEDAREHPELVAQFAEPAMQKMVERIFFIEVVGFNWNCSKYITPRYTVAEIEEAVAPLKRRIAELEAKLANPNAI